MKGQVFHGPVEVIIGKDGNGKDIAVRVPNGIKCEYITDTVRMYSKDEEE